MRDPLGPIPSPAAATSRSERFWNPASLPPPPPGAPLAALRDDSDQIDRRHAPRSDDTPTGTAASASEHDALPNRVLGLRSRYGWSLIRGLTICPAGILVQGVDLLDPHLGAGAAADARAVFSSLAPALNRSSHSLLGLVGGCLLAPRLLEDLAGWGSGLGSRRRPAPLQVTLLVPQPSEPDPTSVEGVLAPLTDPQPDVLAIALDAPSVLRVRQALGVPARR